MVEMFRAVPFSVDVLGPNPVPRNWLLFGFVPYLFFFSSFLTFPLFFVFFVVSPSSSENGPRINDTMTVEVLFSSLLRHFKNRVLKSNRQKNACSNAEMSTNELRKPPTQFFIFHFHVHIILSRPCTDEYTRLANGLRLLPAVCLSYMFLSLFCQILIFFFICCCSFPGPFVQTGCPCRKKTKSKHATFFPLPVSIRLVLSPRR